MADVFISYKRERRRAAEHLKRIVEAHGFSVWYDHVDTPEGGPELHAGSTYRKQIERELRAADVVLVLWCVLARESDWVEDEARLAKQLGTYVPVRVASQVDPPLGLGGDQLVDLGLWDGAPGSHLLHPLLREIERRVGRPSAIRRAEVERIDQDWRLYGAPRMVTFELVRPGPSAEATLPLDWAEPKRVESDVTVRSRPRQPRPNAATLRPWRGEAAGGSRGSLRWIGWAFVATLAVAALSLVVTFGAFHR